MTFKEKITNIIESGLLEKPSLFLVELSVSDAYKVTVALDGDNGVTLQDCIDISKIIDNSLDREEQDFSLEVASAGVSSPLKNIRQYKKNIGRTLKVKTNHETIEAELADANDEFITLKWSSRETKKIGKGKETVEHNREIPYSEIKEALVIIIFN